MKALILLLIATPAWADEFCDGLKDHAPTTGIVVAPCSGGQCGDAENRLVQCLQRIGKVVTPEAFKKAVEESVLRSARGEQLREMALGFGFKHLAITETTKVDDRAVALVRIVLAETGEIVAASRMELGRGAKPGAQSVDGALRLLADKLAVAFRALPGARVKRVAVLPFREGGASSAKNQLGTLVAADLVTRFRRDYGISIVERTRLDAVVKELELKELGLVDDKRASKLGRMVEADAIVIGSTQDAGAFTKLYGQVIDAQTGVVLVADEVSMNAAGLVALSTDAVVLRSKSGALFRSLLIPGWGQIYNGQSIKGYTFLGVALGLGAAAGTTYALSLVAANQYRAATGDFDGLATRAENFALASVITLGALGVFWIANVIEAYVSGVTFDSAVAGGRGAAAWSF